MGATVVRAQDSAISLQIDIFYANIITLAATTSVIFPEKLFKFPNCRACCLILTKQGIYGISIWYPKQVIL